MRVTGEMRAEAARLRALGYGHKRVGRALGVSPTTARRLVDPEFVVADRMRTLAAKRRRHGRCNRCNAITPYHGHRGKAVSDLCASCAVDDNRARGIAKRGHGTMVSRVLIYCATPPRRFSEIRDHFGITDGNAANILHRLVRYGLLTRISRGVYVTAERHEEAA